MKRFFASLSGLIPFLVHAQLAVVEAPDTTLLSGSMFTNEAQPLEGNSHLQQSVFERESADTTVACRWKNLLYSG